MAYQLYTISEICNWYQQYTDHNINQGLLLHMIDNNLVKKFANKRYSLSEINNFLLQKEDCDYIKNSDGKYMMKTNRLPLIDLYKNVKQKNNVNDKFKITKIEGNKFKLIKNE